MKVCVVQPYYSVESGDTEKCFNEMIALLDQCDDSMDLIVLPEYCDVPAYQNCTADFYDSIYQYNDAIMDKAIDTAKRCNALVFVNAAYKCESGWRNTTHAINRNGEVVGRYYKAHPTRGECAKLAMNGRRIDDSYSYTQGEPYVVEIEGIRFGFLTCYDFYFYEAFAPLARQNIDVIIGCSHQRSDTHEALSIINRFLCYNTNAYLLRASVSLGEDSPVGGGSCIIEPDGTVRVDMKSKIGLGVYEIDPSKKYYKKAGFTGNVKAHYEYIEDGRRPWLYRNGGASIVPFDTDMPYPRICAHRGFNTVAPENSMPAFGAAVALGASEIEFDLWPTKDGEIVSIHDDKLDRVSDGSGIVCEYTYEELKQYDFGGKFGEKFKGLRIVLFEDILKKFGGKTIMNIHLKTESEDYDVDLMKKIISLIRKYDCERHVYLMIRYEKMVRQFKAYAPDIRVCLGHLKARPWDIVDRAIEVGAEKVQLYKTYVTREMVEKAHAHGIICNVFYADTPELAREYLDMGIDTILTNDYLAIANATNLK